MNNADLKKGLRKLRDSIEDFLDNLSMDEPDGVSIDAVKDNFAHPNSKKSPSKAEEDLDGKKKEH